MKTAPLALLIRSLVGLALGFVGALPLTATAAPRIQDPLGVMEISDRFFAGVAFEDAIRLGDRSVSDDNECEIHCHEEFGDCRQYCQPTSDKGLTVTACDAVRAVITTGIDLNGTTDSELSRAVYEIEGGNPLRLFFYQGLTRLSGLLDNGSYVQLYGARELSYVLQDGTRVRALEIHLSLNSTDDDTGQSFEMPLTVTFGKGLPYVGQLLELYLYPNIGERPALKLRTLSRTPAPGTPSTPRASGGFTEQFRFSAGKWLTALEVSPDEKSIAVRAGAYTSIGIHELATGKVLRSLEAGGPVSAFHWSRLPGDAGVLSIASVHWDQAPLVRHWLCKTFDAESGQLTSEREGYPRGVVTVLDAPARCARDAMALAYSDSLDTVNLESLDDASKVNSFTLLSGNIAQALFSPDGKFLLTASDDGAALVWSSPAGAVQGGVRHGTSPLLASWSPDGSRYVTVGEAGRSAVVWDTLRSRALARITDQADVRFATFSQGGDILLSGMSDHTARVWDATTGALLATLTGHPDQVLAGQTLGDRRIVTGDASGNVVVWAPSDRKLSP